MDYRSELNDIILFARGDQTMRALLRHEGKVAIPELERFKSAIKTGTTRGYGSTPTYIQSPSNFADRREIAKQLVAYRKKGLIKTNQAEYREGRSMIRKPVEHGNFDEKVNKRLYSASPGAIGSQFTGRYTGQQGEIGGHEIPRLNDQFGNAHYSGSIFARKLYNQQ
jgi:hypothetical protein